MSVSLGKEGGGVLSGRDADRAALTPLYHLPAPSQARPHSPHHSEVVVALAPAFDRLGGAGDGHTLRTAIIGMRLGEALDLGPLALSDLFYSLLLKDLGAAGARAQLYHSYGQLDERRARLLRHADLTDLSQTYPLFGALLGSRAPFTRRLRNAVDLLLGGRRLPAAVERTRSRLASSLALEMGFSHGTAAALRALSERWDGRGRPEGLAGDAIPLGARVVAVAEELDLLLAGGSAALAAERLEQESSRRFDPQVVELALRLAEETDLLAEDLARQLLDLEPVERRQVALASRVDRLLAGVARLVDSRSAWKARHSERVKQLALGAALALEAPFQLGTGARRRLARAALLHDLAKISAPVSLLDEPRHLSEEEKESLRGDQLLHERVVGRVLDLADSALVTESLVIAEAPRGAAPGAAGEGGPDLVRSDPLLEAKLGGLLVHLADRFEALVASRPQRPGLKADEALELLTREVEAETLSRPSRAAWPGGADPRRVALAALKRFVASPGARSLLKPRAFDPNSLVVVDRTPA